MTSIVRKQVALREVNTFLSLNSEEIANMNFNQLKFMNTWTSPLYNHIILC